MSWRTTPSARAGCTVTCSAPSAHELVYEETDARFSIGIGQSRSRAWLFLTSHSATTSEVRYLSAERPQDSFALAVPRRQGHEYYLDHHPDHDGDRFWIVTNDRGRNFRLVTAPVADPREQNWSELIGHRDDVMLDGVDLFARHCVLHERAGGFPRLRVMSLADGKHPRRRRARVGLFGARRGERRVRHRRVPLRLRVAGDPRLGVRLRHEHAPAARCSSSGRCSEATIPRNTLPRSPTPPPRTASGCRFRWSTAATSAPPVRSRCCSPATALTASRTTSTSARRACLCWIAA